MTDWKPGFRVTADRLLNISGQWQSYTPTWGTTGTAPDLGNGTLLGEYTLIGKVVHFDVNFIAGSTTTFGSGSYNFTTPVVAAGSGIIVNVTARCNDSSENKTYEGVGQIGPGDDAVRFLQTESGGAVSSSGPFVWADGDSIRITGTYRAE